MKPTNPAIAKLLCLIKGHEWSYPQHISVGVATCTRCGKQKKLGAG